MFSDSRHSVIPKWSPRFTRFTGDKNRSNLQCDKPNMCLCLHGADTVRPSMLHDITAQTIRLNTGPILCTRHSRSKTQKRVNFDAYGIPCLSRNYSRKAMAGERKQKARINSRPRTPSKPRVRERPVIGSSSTWRKEQLDRFIVGQGVLNVRRMIPEKWFKFENLEYYQLGINASLTSANDSPRPSHVSTDGRDNQQPHHSPEGT